jgi:uncharacterized membrane protein YfcA
LEFLLVWLPIFVLGAGMGFLGGIFGIGGGIIAIPLLVFAFSMDQVTAQGTAAAMMLPNLLLAWWRYARYNPVGISWNAAAAAAVATATTWFAANFAQYVGQGVLQALFAVFLLLLGVSRLWPRHSSPKGRRADQRLIPLVGLAGGSCMGLLGVGGGLVAAPMLTGIFGLTQRAAQTVGLALVTPSAAATLTAYAIHRRVDWPVSCVLAIGGLLTVSYGVTVAHSWPEQRLQRAFGGLLVAMALIIVCKAIW